MKNKIGVIVPLKSNRNVNRLLDLTNLIESWKKTTSGLSDLILVMIDREVDFYLDSFADYDNSNIIIVVGKEMTVVQALNSTAVSIMNDYDVIGFMNDDFYIHSNGWEEKIIEWQEENRGICWGNDLLQGGNLTTHFFMHNTVIKALGFVAPPSMQHFYIDNYWMDLGLLIGKIKYFPDIIFEHRHFSVGKNQKDSVNIEGDLIMGADRTIFDEYRARDLQVRDANIVKEYQKNH